MRIKKYYKLIRVDYEDSEYFRIKNTSNTTGVFTITRVGSPTTADLKYSLDGVNWTTAALSSNFSLEVDAGANVYMKGTNTSGFNRDLNKYYQMAMDVNHTIGGNIMSIVDETNYTTVTSVPQSCFAMLFYNDTNLTDAGGVNFGSVTSIGTSGCYKMYRGCTSLTTPCDLSSVTSIGNSGCAEMYRGCTSLTTPCNLSSVTSIGNSGCASMHSVCTSLTTPCDLSSVTSIENSGCTNMYSFCNSLTKATTPNISSWDTSKFNIWLDQVAATGVVRKPAGLTIPTGISGVPSGWTTEDY